MTQEEQHPEPQDSAERLREYRRGAQLIFENAEELFKEADTLRQAGFLARAAFLHQISMEECAKVDMLGGWATMLLMGAMVDDQQIARAFRDHKAKNRSNAYMASVTPEEDEARQRGDWKSSAEAFERFQQMFHSQVNTTKNAALYVDFEASKFISPKEVVTEETVIAMAALNYHFLSVTFPFLRLLERMANESDTFEGFVTQITRRAHELRDECSSDPEKVMHQLLEEMRKTYK
jgi:AbiV family abortive infection protein